MVPYKSIDGSNPPHRDGDRALALSPDGARPLSTLRTFFILDLRGN